LVGFWEFQQGFLSPPLNGCIVNFVLLSLLLCRQKKLVYVCWKDALFLGPKLQKNLNNNDIGNEVYLCSKVAIMTNEIYILEKLKHFKSPKQIQVVEHKVYF